MNEEHRWISVNDKLPETDNSYVLVACEGGNVDKSFFSTNREFLASGRGHNSYSRNRLGKWSGYFMLSHKYGYRVTHWMSLPDAPSGENQ